MSFLAPGFLIAAAAAALAVVGIHFLSPRDAKVKFFPTTRFIPDSPTRATATRLQLTDIGMLLLRVLLVLVLGAALARPILTPAHRATAQVVAVDVSRAVGQSETLPRAVLPYVSAADVVILFDSAARVIQPGATDSIPLERRAFSGARRGSLSVALIASLREAARLSRSADSIELVIASPFLAEQADAATWRLRELWPGRITAVELPAAEPDQQPDSIVVVWADSLSSEHWVAMASPDTMSAIRAGDAVLVHPLIRRWQVSDAVPAGARVYARWADGEPAALEIPESAGCVRTMGFALPQEGDVLLRPDFQRFAASLSRPCGEPRDLTPLSAGVLGLLRGSGSLASSAEINSPIVRVTPLMPWLLAIVALLGLVESAVRDRRRNGLHTRRNGAGERAADAGPEPTGTGSA